MAGKPNKAGKSGKPSPAGKRGGRRPASAQQHPGEVLREILADTPPALAAKWFGLSATELEAFYHGELPLTPWPKPQARYSARAQPPGST